MKRFLLLILLSALSVGGYAQSTKLQVGAERMELLLPLLEGKRVALMVNQSSLVGSTGTHLVDTLLSRGVKVVRLFVPEHGLRGKVDAGKAVKSALLNSTTRRQLRQFSARVRSDVMLAGKSRAICSSSSVQSELRKR